MNENNISNLNHIMLRLNVCYSSYLFRCFFLPADIVDVVVGVVDAADVRSSFELDFNNPLAFLQSTIVPP